MPYEEVYTMIDTAFHNIFGDHIPAEESDKLIAELTAEDTCLDCPIVIVCSKYFIVASAIEELYKDNDKDALTRILELAKKEIEDNSSELRLKRFALVVITNALRWMEVY